MRVPTPPAGGGFVPALAIAGVIFRRCRQAARPPPESVNIPHSATDRTRHLRGILLMLLSVSCISVLDTTGKYLTRTYPVYQVVWARYVFHVFFMVVLLAPHLGRELVRTRRPDLQLARGLVLTLATFVFFKALSLMPLAEASAIAFLSPVLVTVLAVPLLGERANLATWIALGLGFLGTLLIIRPGTGVFSWNALWPLATALCFATYQIITRKLAGIDRSVSTLFLSALTGAIILSFVAPFHWMPPLSLADGLLFASLGISGSVSHYFLIRAFALAPAPMLAPFVYVQLIMVTLLGYLVFGDFPDGISLAGMAVIVVAGIWLITRGHRAPAT